MTSVAMFHPMLSYYRNSLFNELNSELGEGLVLYSVPAGHTSGLGGSEDELRVEVRRSRTYRLGPVWIVPRALATMWSRRWDVLVLSWNVRQVEVLPVLLIARLRRLPVVLWGHGMGRSTSRLQRTVRRWQARLASGVVTYSERGAGEVSHEAPGSRVHVVDNTPGRPPPDPTDALVEPTGRLAYVGRLVPRKRVELLIEAVALLRDGGLELGLDIVGDGSSRTAILESVDHLGLSDSIEWHGRVTEWGRLRTIIAGCDLVVIPGHAGLAVVDAFAAGRGAVVPDDQSNNPPELDLVADGETGFRFGPPTAEALARRLREAYADPREIVDVSRRAIEVYRERLTVEVAATAFRDSIVAAMASMQR